MPGFEAREPKIIGISPFDVCENDLLSIIDLRFVWLFLGRSDPGGARA